MTISELEIVDVANAVWQSMLGMETYALDPDTPLATGPYITATVLISGEFEGGVTLHLASSVGRSLAALMFGMELDEVSADETTDAVGELANMVGGNLKALVPQPAKLSLPSVAEGDNYKVTFPGTEESGKVALGFEGNVMYIVLHSRTDATSKRNTETHRSVA